jgi:hypothetical protein
MKQQHQQIQKVMHEKFLNASDFETVNVGSLNCGYISWRSQ